jgi:hypothetical protein
MPQSLAKTELRVFQIPKGNRNAYCGTDNYTDKRRAKCLETDNSTRLPLTRGIAAQLPELETSSTLGLQ